jgi:hypothetical protein
MARNLVFLFLCFFMFVSISSSQEKKEPLSLDAVKASLEINEFKVAEIVNAIDLAGIDFKLDETNLTVLLDAAKKAGRPSSEISAVFSHLVKACRTCRDMFWAPLSPEDLLDWVKKSPVQALDELKVRGSQPLPTAVDFIEQLRGAGAPPELIAIVEERQQIPAPDGYKPMRLEKAPGFDTLATSGKLVLDIEADGEVEFVFRHNALFFKTIRGADPKNLDCTYTAFGPVADSPRDWSLEGGQTGKKAKKGKEAVITRKDISDSDGRRALVVNIKNVDPGVHEYQLALNWKR